MALTKDDWKELGRKAARGGDVTTPREGSWQHKAFMEGYDEAKPRRFSGGPSLQSMPKGTASVPGLRFAVPSTGRVEDITVRPLSPHYAADISKLRVVDVPQVYSIMQANVAPRAACEHVKLLGAAHNEEHDLKRRARLHRSIGRVLTRWVNRDPHWPAVLGVPMKMPQLDDGGAGDERFALPA